MSFKIIYYEQCQAQAQKKLLTLTVPNCNKLKKYQWQNINNEFVNIHQTDYRQTFMKQANKSALRAAIKQEFNKIKKMEKIKPQEMTIKTFLETFPGCQCVITNKKGNKPKLIILGGYK